VNTIFREYDIRGIYEKELNEQSVKLIGYFLSQKIKGEYVAIGYDARVHSPILCEYLTSGLNKGGKKVLNMGMVPTPVNYFANYQEFDGVTPSASIMITGSHNPSEYNGFKITIDKKPFFGEDIYALGKEILDNLDMKIEDSTQSTIIDVKSRYIEYLTEQFKDIKIDTPIAIDCGNGVAGIVLEDILKNIGIEYKGLYTDPDGSFPNHHPDPSVEKNLIDLKKELKGSINLGFAYDGDSDRIAVLTQKNNIKGDILALLFAKGMNNPTVIGEVKCSQVMYDEIDKIGTSIMYKTGHSNLKVKIKETNADLAAEVSGHIFFNDRFFGFDDAIYSTFRVLELVSNGLDLDDEIDKLPLAYSTEEIKVETTEQEKFKIIDKLKELLKNPPSTMPTIKNIIDVDGVRVNFENGWGLVRASNTTPVLVTRFESLKEEDAKLYEVELNKLIKEAKESL
jgi:phosphomannomutase/phosphoglucomutase